MRVFPGEYAEQLADKYGHEISDQITDPYNVRFAHVDAAPGAKVPYAVVSPVEEAADRRPVLYVPGFGEGIINKASFAAELALRGREVILLGQSRRGTLSNEEGRRDATYTQAINTLAVQQMVGARSADVVTHSYGSLVFDEMVRQAPEWFKGSNVAMLSPAGSIYNQRLLAMGAQWVGFMKSETDGDRPMEFPDPDGVTGKASARVLAANPLRTVREVRDLWQREVDYENVSRSVASLAVLSYAEDAMFPEDKLAPMLTDAVEAGHIVWATPADFGAVDTGRMRYAGEGSVHDDEQYNPSRVAAAVLDYL